MLETLPASSILSEFKWRSLGDDVILFSIVISSSFMPIPRNKVNYVNYVTPINEKEYFNYFRGA
jgi:hypothetical protein